jgi:hypothetical protein
VGASGVGQLRLLFGLRTAAPWLSNLIGIYETNPILFESIALMRARPRPVGRDTRRLFGFRLNPEIAAKVTLQPVAVFDCLRGDPLGGSGGASIRFEYFSGSFPARELLRRKH